MKIYVSNVKNISGKRLVSGIISTVDGNGERDKEAFTLKPIGACMVHDIYSIRITDISDDYECAGFATSFDDKPCK